MSAFQQILLAMAGSGLPATLRDYVGTLTVGSDSFASEGPPVIAENYYGFGTVYTAFGSLSPAGYGGTTFTDLYAERLLDGGTSSNALNVGRSGTDTTSTMFPTINDYPLANGGLTGILDTTALTVNLPENLLGTKFLSATVTLRFALRTDIIQAVGSGNLVVPTGATRAIIYALGGGGGGARVASGSTRRGGGNGAIVVSDISVASGQWGTNMAYTVGAAGVGRVSSAGNGTAGGATTLTHAGLGVSINAGGGGGATTTLNGSGGTASGGNVSNTNGSAGTSATGLNPEQDTAFRGAHQGGAGGVAANAQDGRAGLVAVVWY